MTKRIEGRIVKVSGPVVVASGMGGAKMYDVCEVSDEKLIGEIIELKRDHAVIQVYEETSGLKVSDKVVSLGEPLSCELGPGIMGAIYDGIQRPLELIRKNSGIFIKRGERPPSVDRERKWKFKACVKKGDKVSRGMVLGSVMETDSIEHKIMVPNDVSEGVVEKIESGEFRVTDEVCVLMVGGAKRSVSMLTRCPVRERRPYKERFAPVEPLVTGQRVMDTLYPIAKGGTAAIPGPFGAGKTVTLHQIAKFSNADIIVYVGCGERGNEMTDVLTDFPKLKDPHTGRSLIEKTVLIANTSNMPVAAREASIYTGVTIAEYYRDMGYSVALIADSTSRWAEAMREISSRLEEMPGEEGYPAYIASRLSQFYERAGLVETFAGSRGSVSIIGAVSPQGGDFSEPVTQSTIRVVKCFWGLDSKLADMRHFPAVNWNKSYSLYVDTLSAWYGSNLDDDWVKLRAEFVRILKRETELKEVVQLVGMNALPYPDQVDMLAAKMIREDFLQQDVGNKYDIYTTLLKQIGMMKAILAFYRNASKISGTPDIKNVRMMNAVSTIAHMRYEENKEFEGKVDALIKGIDAEFEPHNRLALSATSPKGEGEDKVNE